MDCPLCGQSVGFQQGKIGPAPAGVPLVRRNADKAAEWAPLGAKYAGGTLTLLAPPHQGATGHKPEAQAREWVNAAEPRRASR